MKIFLDWLLEQITKVNMATFITALYRISSLIIIAFILVLIYNLYNKIETIELKQKAMEVHLENELKFEIHKRALKKEVAEKGGRGVNPSSQKRWKTTCLILISKKSPILDEYAFDRSRTLGESCAVLVRD
jgi:uncharacterized membrane protein